MSDRKSPADFRRTAARWSGVRQGDNALEVRIGKGIEPQPNGCWLWKGRADKYGETSVSRGGKIGAVLLAALHGDAQGATGGGVMGEYKVWGWVPVTAELLCDADPVALTAHLADAFDRMANPWNYPDNIHWPYLDPFPRWTRIMRWKDHVTCTLMDRLDHPRR